MVAYSLHQKVMQSSSKDNEIIAAAKGLVMFMTRLSQLVCGEGGTISGTWLRALNPSQRLIKWIIAAIKWMDMSWMVSHLVHDKGSIKWNLIA